MQTNRPPHSGRTQKKKHTARQHIEKSTEKQSKMNELELIGLNCILGKFHAALAEQCTENKPVDANRSRPHNHSIVLSHKCAKDAMPLLMSDFGVHEKLLRNRDFVRRLLVEHEAVMANWGNAAIKPERFAHLRLVAQAISSISCDYAKTTRNMPVAEEAPEEDFAVQRSPFMDRSTNDLRSAR
jgi:hypothetical protein